MKKGLYIATSPLLEFVEECKFGMSMKLQSKIFHFMIFLNNPSFYACYEFDGDYNKTEIRFIERVILHVTSKYRNTNFFTSEYRKMDKKDLDSTVKKVLLDFGVKYIYHNPVTFEQIRKTSKSGIKKKEESTNRFIKLIHKFPEYNFSVIKTHKVPQKKILPKPVIIENIIKADDIDQNRAMLISKTYNANSINEKEYSLQRYIYKGIFTKENINTTFLTKYYGKYNRIHNLLLLLDIKKELEIKPFLELGITIRDNTYTEANLKLVKNLIVTLGFDISPLKMFIQENNNPIIFDKNVKTKNLNKEMLSSNILEKSAFVLNIKNACDFFYIITKEYKAKQKIFFHHDMSLKAKTGFVNYFLKDWGIVLKTVKRNSRKEKKCHFSFYDYGLFFDDVYYTFIK